MESVGLLLDDAEEHVDTTEIMPHFVVDLVDASDGAPSDAKPMVPFSEVCSTMTGDTCNQDSTGGVCCTLVISEN